MTAAERRDRANRAIPILWDYHAARVGPANVYDRAQRDSLRELIRDLETLATREGWEIRP